MNKLLCSFIDNHVLRNIHKVKSGEPQYIDCQYTERTFEGTYPDPVVPDITFKANVKKGNYNIGEYRFKSLVESGYDVNNYCMGEYFKNDNGYKNAVNAILVHGWRADSTSHLKDVYLNEFMKRGYNVYTYTLPYHFERKPDGAYNGEYLITANIERTISAIVQAATDLRTLILYLKREKGSKAFLIGHSLGGLVTNITAVLERNIDLLISISYANSMAFSTFYTIPGKYVKKDFVENSNITFEELTKRWSVIIPSFKKPIIPKDNILLISGKHDEFVLEEDTKALWTAWDKPQRLIHKCGHAGIVLNKKAILKDSLSFIDKRLQCI